MNGHKIPPLRTSRPTPFFAGVKLRHKSPAAARREGCPPGRGGGAQPAGSAAGPQQGARLCPRPARRHRPGRRAEGQRSVEEPGGAGAAGTHGGRGRRERLRRSRGGGCGERGRVSPPPRGTVPAPQRAARHRTTPAAGLGHRERCHGSQAPGAARPRPGRLGRPETPLPLPQPRTGGRPGPAGGEQVSAPGREQGQGRAQPCPWCRPPPSVPAVPPPAAPQRRARRPIAGSCGRRAPPTRHRPPSP